jgi:hypothetical protein
VRSFACQHCGHLVGFADATCATCRRSLGFLAEEREVVVVEPSDAALFATPYEAGARRYWRCLNASWGCNWMVPAEGGETWCASCRLTRGRPDTADVSAVQAWMDTEAAKRLLVFELGELGLPVERRGEDAPDGLAFDLVFVPGATSVTGHLGGLVTIDLTEADDAHREHLRRMLGEPYRTMLGHLRHEMGHYYWPRLVDRAGALDGFRDLFGDERADYAAAMRRLAEHGAPAEGWADDHVSAYASAHPWEDWAETFAHYIHIRDTVQTANSFGLRLADPEVGGRPVPIAPAPVRDVVADPAFAAILAEWVPLVHALNAVNRSMGQHDLYPFVLTPAVMRKLGFVHDRVVGR